MINSLYVHIPFCLKKCLYCDFNSYPDIELQEAYLEALEAELSGISQNNFKTIFVGGGTPTILSLSSLERLLKILYKYNAKEYTFESNPGTLNKEKLLLMKKYGVNRLSIGLQAYQNKLLKKLGRIHNLSDFMESYRNARECGFNNINIDLMFGIPDQNIEDWDETIGEVISLKPEHISCYSLIIEEDTPYYKMEQQGQLALSSEEDEREMYYRAAKEFEKNGYLHYEISNFSLKGFECKHNITYWRNEEYYGVGAGAHSFVNEVRYSNYREPKIYIKKTMNGNSVETENITSLGDEIAEYMFLGLRMMEGISTKSFKKRFDLEICEIYQRELSELKRDGLITYNEENIKLTKRGIDLSNQVFVRFLR